ncbi:uncharacterized protein PAC_08216 [Phialocephala subalpina]|uniref:SET domain-containing protein n=1 Tax=Phialocephala subalpina TaxID=576137 RepID=A0A1L7WZX9_9HELO|nr:uncharacterized protein PAC_08216 [Phialocephala subalpina]
MLPLVPPPEVMEAVLRSVHRTWENFYEGSVSPNEFMCTPFGAPYEIVAIAGKGRGVIASRDIKAAEVIIQDTPKALEGILLLHNETPDLRHFSAARDIPVHRLLNRLQGILDTNCFSTDRASCGSIGLLLLTGALFNHSDSPNMTRQWDNTTEKMVFSSVRDIEEGEESEVDYVPGGVGAARAERLRGYGLKNSKGLSMLRAITPYFLRQQRLRVPPTFAFPNDSSHLLIAERLRATMSESQQVCEKSVLWGGEED